VFCKDGAILHSFAVTGPTTMSSNGSARNGHHDRRATGCKMASPAIVLRGEVRPLHWAEPIGQHGQRCAGVSARGATLSPPRTRFRRNPDAHLATLEQQACQLTFNFAALVFLSA